MKIDWKMILGGTLLALCMVCALWMLFILMEGNPHGVWLMIPAAVLLLLGVEVADV